MDILRDHPRERQRPEDRLRGHALRRIPEGNRDALGRREELLGAGAQAPRHLVATDDERLQGALLPSLREYARTFGVGARTLAYAKPDALVMHPGPMNRGVEISSDVADGAQSAVLEQVEAGVAVRMAVLYLLAAEPGERAGG